MRKKAGTYRILFSVLSALLLAGFGNLAKAQNNPYKIADSLYPTYQDAMKHNREELGLQLADKLFNQAVRIKDKKAQCLALTIPIIYYYNNREDGHDENMEKAVVNLQKLARKNGYLQYYYYAANYRTNNLLNQNKTLAALQTAEQTKQEAFADNYPFGIVSSMRSMGTIYTTRYEFRLALKCFEESLKYTEEFTPEQDLAFPCYLAGNALSQLKEYEKAYKILDKGCKVAKTATNRHLCMIGKSIALYYLDRWDEFETCYEECEKVTKEINAREAYMHPLRVYHLIVDGQYEQAHKLSFEIHAGLHYLIGSEIYQKEGKFEEACRYLGIHHNRMDSVSRSLRASDVYELNVRIGNEQLKKETQALQLENAELNLQQTNLELAQAQSQVEMERINTRNNLLELQNRNLELEQEKAKAEQEQNVMKARQLKSNYKLLVVGFVLSFFVLIAAVLTYYIYTRRKTVGLLKSKNEELTVARDQAEQADKMKTFFIQNMSHEIRTPLNSIVGFSQILSDPEMELDNEEKKEYSQLVQHNSDLLTTLVNDILDLASLESGKYTMELGNCSCNEMGRMCISTVKHRNPDNVKLYYTSDVPDDFTITTDGKRLQQVLINFLTNAEKYTEKGEIRLHCSLAENPGKVTFSVTDTGSGIPLDQMDTVFERFKKLDEFKQGTGLGLNICRLIAERLHGEVKIDKSYTDGARFLFILPLE